MYQGDFKQRLLLLRFREYVFADLRLRPFLKIHHSYPYLDTPFNCFTLRYRENFFIKGEKTLFKNIMTKVTCQSMADMWSF